MLRNGVFSIPILDESGRCVDMIAAPVIDAPVIDAPVIDAPVIDEPLDLIKSRMEVRLSDPLM
jgi:hypothetical protein